MELDQDQMFIDHGRLYCSAGVNAGLDLTLYLIEKFYGRENATHTAKTMILDYGRKKQTPYESFLFPKEHADAKIIEAQKWIDQNSTSKDLLVPQIIII